jgi:DDE superfamily endonuclease
LVVARLAVLLLVPPGQDLRAAMDDSVFRRHGRKVHGAGWQHDGSAPARDKFSYGNCFVTVALVVRLPSCSREVGLPVLARLHLPGNPKKQKRQDPAAPAAPLKVETAAAQVALLAAALPGRTVHVVPDAAYHGRPLRDLAGNVTWTSARRL